MNKNNISSALIEKHKAPEHHRVKPPTVQYQFKTSPGHCYCMQCGAISFQKHWYLDPAMEKHLRSKGTAKGILCPGCKRIEEQLFEGEVIVANSKFAILGGEIAALIKHTEGRLWHHNPMAKITACEGDHGEIRIQTTTRMLAETIGKELHKTFKGKLVIKRSREEKFVRIYWKD